jgi:hypothetical protein
VVEEKEHHQQERAGDQQRHESAVATLKEEHKRKATEAEKKYAAVARKLAIVSVAAVFYELRDMIFGTLSPAEWAQRGISCDADLIYDANMGALEEGIIRANLAKTNAAAKVLAEQLHKAYKIRLVYASPESVLKIVQASPIRTGRTLMARSRLFHTARAQTKPHAALAALFMSSPPVISSLICQLKAQRSPTLPVKTLVLSVVLSLVTSSVPQLNAKRKEVPLPSRARDTHDGQSPQSTAGCRCRRCARAGVCGVWCCVPGRLLDQQHHTGRGHATHWIHSERIRGQVSG